MPHSEKKKCCLSPKMKKTLFPEKYIPIKMWIGPENSQTPCLCRQSGSTITILPTLKLQIRIGFTTLPNALTCLRGGSFIKQEALNTLSPVSGKFPINYCCYWGLGIPG
jgi:hypothetical protein